MNTTQKSHEENLQMQGTADSEVARKDAELNQIDDLLESNEKAIAALRESGLGIPMAERLEMCNEVIRSLR